MHCFSEVERPSFKNLWSTLTNVQLMSRKTLVKKINDAYTAMIEDIDRSLSSVDLVCITADCWTSHYKSLLGVTCHWIDPNTLERKNVGLACCRIFGKHTYDVVGKRISEVLLKFKIQNKVILSVTDSGSNFIKAFKTFGSEDVVEDDLEEHEEFEITPISLDEILENGEETFNEISLPPHRRCSAHMLNLVAKDVEKATESDGVYKKMSRAAFAKCQSLWNKSRQSSKAADTIRQHLTVNLKVPVVTRWHSFHSSVSWMCQFFEGEKMDKMNLVCDEIGLPRFKEAEVDFLKEYADVLDPLTKALDILQGDKNISIGYLLPTLHQLLHYLDVKIKHNLKYCTVLANSVKETVQKRFGNDLWNKDLVLAACFHPRFKLAWITDPTKKQEARIWMEETIRLQYPQQRLNEHQEQEPETDDEDDDFDITKRFFNFKSDAAGSVLTWQEELDNYHNEGVKPFKSLKTMMYLKSTAVRLNTPIPSSASVERLFSAGGNVFGSKRAKLTDVNFEHQLLLKYNSTT